MKHCHFSILYNEIGFLKQKLPFLYQHFHQIIFYDLSAFDGKMQFSSDGSHEWIKGYPDPEKKITLIERRDLGKIKPIAGNGTNLTKRRMFTIGSSFVSNDIDVFWCTDMDEFFTEDLIREVEEILKDPGVDSIENEHFLFWKDLHILNCRSNEDLSIPFISRIARHRKGNIYGHCSLKAQFPKNRRAKNKIYHFSNVGKEKTFQKIFKYYGGTRKGYREIWEEVSKIPLKPGEFYNGREMHPGRGMPGLGIMIYPGDLEKELPYVNFPELAKDLKCNYK